ncbi:IS3 family transposase, partial [Bifidobacterium longum subsp. infantis]|uniref:IS3 family transposase n=1 Tax=Bifidobacterium longum TaxID=216816 RepID=UPI003D075801
LKVPGLPAYRDTCAWGVYLASLGLSVLGLPPPWSASRKGNCIDNAATEQVFGYLKDEFYTGREFASYEEFRTGLDAYMVHWNTKRRQKQLEGHTPEEFRNMSLIA